MHARTSWLLRATAAALLATTPAPVLNAQQAQPPANVAAERVARGEYLVEHAVQCWRCHSPLDASGERDRRYWLLGAPVDVTPTLPTKEWAIVAPRIAGRPAGTDEDFVRLMTTGIGRSGTPIRPPMPWFTMTQADAEAILAYLKTVTRDHGTR